MSDVDLVKRMTEELCENNHHEDVLEKYFAPNFTFWTNGQEGDLGELASRLAGYAESYENMAIPNWDVIFASADGVVVSYIFEANRKDGGTERSVVMAIWQLENGKIASLREVLAGL